MFFLFFKFIICRTKTDDSELDSSYQLDLDSSFKRILDEKRQLTNKENDPKVAPSGAGVSISAEPNIATINFIEKPLRRDLLKERLLHRIQDDSLNLDNSTSYIGENSFGTDVEYATINRLMADFNINRDSTIGQKRSPLKALRYTGEVATDLGGTFMPMPSAVRKLQSPNISENDLRKCDAITEQGAVAKEETVQANADDTLEEIEYVLDRGLNYVPKRLIQRELKEESLNDSGNDENESGDENSENDLNAAVKPVDKSSDDVIVIDSSPENSFITTRNTAHFTSALESTANTFYTAKTDFDMKSKASIIISDESSPEIDCANETISSNESENDTIADKSFESSTCSMSKDQSGLPDFNDSLERFEYMMRQGEKLYNKNLNSPSVNCSPRKLGSPSKTIERIVPKPRTPIGGTIKKLLPVSSGKKVTPKPATPIKNDLFKRPARSPHVQSHHTQSQSRIPTKSKIPPLNSQNGIVSSLVKPQFRHIASPIAAYIKNTPEVPLMKTIKSNKNLMATDFVYSAANKTLDESTQSVEMLPTKSTLPRKMYISAEKRQVK